MKQVLMLMAIALFLFTTGNARAADTMKNPPDYSSTMIGNDDLPANNPIAGQESWSGFTSFCLIYRLFFQSIPRRQRHETERRHEYPNKFILHDVETSGCKEPFQADRRYLDRPPWEKVPFVAERRKERDSKTAVRHGIENAM